MEEDCNGRAIGMVAGEVMGKGKIAYGRQQPELQVVRWWVLPCVVQCVPSEVQRLKVLSFFV